MDLKVVEKFREHYLNKKLSNPDLYRNSDTMITVVLPAELLDYSNASAGHSGFGSGARAVGIRKTVKNSDRALADIFESVENLAKFISESECDGPAYVESVRQRHLASQTPVDPKSLPARSIDLNKTYGAGTIADLLAKFKKESLFGDYNTLTVGEFEQKYNLAELPVLA
jgi:hypothetical protein